MPPIHSASAGATLSGLAELNSLPKVSARRASFAAGAPQQALRQSAANPAERRPPSPVTINASSNQRIKTDVSKLSYAENGSRQVGYFKPARRDTTGFTPKAEAIGIDKQNPNFHKREVAASIVGAHLVPGLVPRTRLATHNSTIGHIQDEAKGSPASDHLGVENIKTDAGGKMSIPLKPNALSEDGKEQLGDLHVFDTLIGNVDRHPKNYMVHQGHVVAIDSEMSFPSIPHLELKNIAGSTLGEMPAGYSQGVREKIGSMDGQWAQQHLAGLLDKRQIDGFNERLTAIKQDMANKPATAAAPQRYSEAFMG
nr:hypothetical protein HUO10_005314 [Paraburkholderia busanensis]